MMTNTEEFPSKSIVDDEPLGRFLLSRSHFSSLNNRVKYTAFMPPADLQLSVFRTQNLSEEEIWMLGEKEVVNKAPTPKTLHGRAELIPLTVKKVGLKLYPDNTPPRHANIIGWPQDKSETKQIALELAEDATLKLWIKDSE